VVHTQPVASRFVTWVLILLGALEIPWVIYLAFTQESVVRTFHFRLATLGLGSFAVVLCAAAAWAVYRSSSWTPALAVAAATTITFLATLARLTPSLDTSGLLGFGLSPLLVTLPGILAAVYAAWVSLLDRAPEPGGAAPSPRPVALRVAAVVLAVTAVGVAARIVLHVLQWDSTVLATQTRTIIVILDTFQVIGLLGAGLASLTGHVRGTLVLATIAGSLLVCDAYGNVVMSGSGEAFTAALFYLFVGELPSFIFCVLAIRAAHRRMAAVGLADGYIEAADGG
jgi:hypothetical protein